MGSSSAVWLKGNCTVDMVLHQPRVRLRYIHGSVTSQREIACQLFPSSGSLAPLLTHTLMVCSQ